MNKTVLITGTTSGMGEQFANIFAKNGYNIVLVARNKDLLNKQRDELASKYGVNVESIISDLSEENSATVIYNQVIEKKIQIDILINNAGFNESGYFIKSNVNNEMDMINVHITTLTYLTKLFAKDMVERGEGKILNMGSTASFMYCPLDAVYAATKMYVYSFSNALRAELKGTGVSVTTLCPGATKTQFAKKANMESTLLFKIGVMDTEKVVQIGYKALMKNRRYKIPGLYNKILVVSSKITPPFILDMLSKKLLSR